MSILDTLLSEIESDDFDEQVRIISDRIMAEELGTNQEEIDAYDGPSGSNVFISLRVPLDSKEKVFISLEREMPHIYIVGHWTRVNDKAPLKRLKVWTCPDVNESKKVIKFFGEKLKFLKGE